jgi:PAS domain-containing protein
VNRAEKQDAEAFRLSYDQLSQILQSAVDGITAVSSSGRIEYMNEAAAHLLGFPHADILLGADWSEVTGQLEAFDEAGHAVEAGNWPIPRVLRATGR